MSFSTDDIMHLLTQKSTMAFCPLYYGLKLIGLRGEPFDEDWLYLLLLSGSTLSSFKNQFAFLWDVDKTMT
jgi:hypothetical protein